MTLRHAQGRFITLEGGEGVGKSTQAGLLAMALRERGKTVVVTREPGGTPGAEAIRDLVMTGAGNRWDARAEALLFAAARADHVARVIRPALDRDDWVICDRFVDSTRAYQGGAGGVSDAEIMALHAIGSGGLMPDRTLILRLPMQEAGDRALERDAGRTDRFGGRGPNYHASLTAFFDTLGELEPERCRLVDARGAAEAVTARLFDAIGDVL